MTLLIQPVILCGGAGTRLWPESRGTRAKQFLPLAGEASLFQQTVARTPAGRDFLPPQILCGDSHVATVREQLGDREAALIVEPMPRGTAAAIALAVAQADADTLLLVMPSDHVIADVPAFHAAIAKAVGLAQQDRLVTFGITPDRPDTGFGYIASGRPLGGGGEDWGFAVDRFVEKPPLEEAERMLAAGGYNWNAGIFLFRAGRMRDAMLTHCRAIFEAADKAVAAGMRDGDALYADAIAFERAPSDSIDYAVMEREDRTAVVPVAMGWSDLGSWHAVHALAEGKDDGGNAVAGDAFLHDSRGNLVRAGGKRVSLVGMEHVAVIVDGDDILVMPLARSQDVRAAAKARE
ncbi:mannose-1-phosphate guanylyltransferase/mannose-6-phosphate isomerase [Sphingopyxis panaciterrae]|uniref:mannose-1-phosphate guanylyltransferase n=1 Tax=Sphingopyxis panaciterrae TaxID=363841 RepID=UPI00142484A7|nr:sugar phosphate nucleotidyltransferase [Sphingopyxis panaciterrae]NIJ37079.1 mannose-1-phosphate guanylyltransferase/mannose-6-phosphate isomerase [Sphingopyxis panaciterrae]